MKKGFTMAEVLIVIGIIGIIAAMTLPTTIAKYKSMVVATQLKKLYSATSQAMLKAVPEGDFENIPIADGGYLGAKNFYEFYLKKQFNTIHECLENDEDGCWALTKKTDGKSNYSYTHGYGSGTIAFVTADGYNFSIDTWNAKDWESVKNNFGVNVTGKTHIAVIHVDANGMKSPNVIGKDVFVFVLSEKGLMPAGSDKTDNEVEDECKTTGRYCFSKIMRNNWTVDPKDAW